MYSYRTTNKTTNQSTTHAYFCTPSPHYLTLPWVVKELQPILKKPRVIIHQHFCNYLSSSSSSNSGSSTSSHKQQQHNKSILFCGDSYMRHLFQAVLLLLTQNYETGSLKDNIFNKCKRFAQFEERECRKYIRTSVVVKCSQQQQHTNIHLSLRSESWCKWSKKEIESVYDKIIWSGGNHPVDLNYTTRFGINNANIVNEHVFQPLCRNQQQQSIYLKVFAFKRLLLSKLIWVETHARWIANARDEHATNVRQYANLSSQLIQSTCYLPQHDTQFN